MVANFLIGVTEEGRSVTEVNYVHKNGFPSDAGRTLLEHYRDAGKVRALMALGDLSYLGASLEPDGGRHERMNPQPGVCYAYRRDLNRTPVAPLVFMGVRQFEVYAGSWRGRAFAYHATLTADGVASWSFMERDILAEFRPLTPEMVEADSAWLRRLKAE